MLKYFSSSIAAVLCVALSLASCTHSQAQVPRLKSETITSPLSLRQRIEGSSADYPLVAFVPLAMSPTAITSTRRDGYLYYWPP